MSAARGGIFKTALILVCSSLASTILICGLWSLLAGPPPVWLWLGLVIFGIVASIGLAGVLHGHAEDR